MLLEASGGHREGVCVGGGGHLKPTASFTIFCTVLLET